MGRVSFRHGVGVGNAPPTPSSIPMSEHRRLMQEQAHGYELRLLELRKQLPGGLPLEPPKPSIEKSTVQPPSPPPKLETEPKAELVPEVPPEEESTEDKSELDELREMAEKSTVQPPSPPPKLETEPKAELVPEVPPEEESTEDKSELDELREMAEKAGVKVDKRWGADRLYVEIEKAEAESGKD